MRGQLIYNPMAGRFPSQALVERSAKILETNGWEMDVVQTNGGSHIAQLSKRAAVMGLDAVFIAGGDGSLHQAAAGLLDSDTALAVLPAGTANVWAQELGLPSLSWTNLTALDTSVNKLLNGEVRTMDVGICQGIPFLLWGGIGFDAFIVHHLEPRSRWQKQFASTQYFANAAWYARTWSGMDLQIWADGEKVTGTYIVAVVTNIHLYAGGLAELSTSARIDDGKMDLWLFAGDSLQEIIQHMYDLASGRHFESENISFISCQEILIKSSQDLFLQLDGEPVQPSKKVSIMIQPQSLKVMVPKDLPRQLFSKGSL
jgi:YegS/Rv2252/BmrU family lipid kinase